MSVCPSVLHKIVESNQSSSFCLRTASFSLSSLSQPSLSSLYQNFKLISRDIRSLKFALSCWSLLCVDVSPWASAGISQPWTSSVAGVGQCQLTPYVSWSRSQAMDTRILVMEEDCDLSCDGLVCLRGHWQTDTHSASSSLQSGKLMYRTSTAKLLVSCLDLKISQSYIYALWIKGRQQK